MKDSLTDPQYVNFFPSLYITYLQISELGNQLVSLVSCK